jgi:hypothetical protein
MSVREKVLAGLAAAGGILTYPEVVELLDYPERGQLMNTLRTLEREGVARRQVAFENGAVSHTVQLL